MYGKNEAKSELYFTGATMGIDFLRLKYKVEYAKRATSSNPLKISVLWNKMFKRG